jgi:cell division protein FtsW
LKRVVVFPEQSAQRMKAAPHVTNSILALAAGRVFGTWIDGATQKYDHVGEQQTDFVLSLIGEELGFVGTSLVVLLFLSLIAAGAVISWRIQDPFGQLLTAGVTFMIALQAVINIAVITGSLPCKGLPLPFVSLGGSNLVSLLTGVGLLASAALRAPRQEAASPVKPEVKTQSAGVGTPRFTAPATEQ